MRASSAGSPRDGRPTRKSWSPARPRNSIRSTPPRPTAPSRSNTAPSRPRATTPAPRRSSFRCRVTPSFVTCSRRKSPSADSPIPPRTPVTSRSCAASFGMILLISSTARPRRSARKSPTRGISPTLPRAAGRFSPADLTTARGMTKPTIAPPRPDPSFPSMWIPPRVTTILPWPSIRRTRSPACCGQTIPSASRSHGPAGRHWWSQMPKAPVRSRPLLTPAAGSMCRTIPRSPASTQMKSTPSSRRAPRAKVSSPCAPISMPAPARRYPMCCSSIATRRPMSGALRLTPSCSKTTVTGLSMKPKPARNCSRPTR